jgi:hypothetical protein
MKVYMNTLPKQIAVLAGSYRQFRQYCAENDLNPARVSYISDRDSLRGFRGTIVKYGTWQERKDLREIEEELGMRRALGDVEEI